MKMSEIKQMTDAELENLEQQLLKERFNLGVQRRTGHLQNSARVRQIRRDNARIKTEWKSRETKNKAV